MIQLPPAFAVSCTEGRWFAVAPSNWSSLAAGRTFHWQLRAVETGSLVTGDVSYRPCDAMPTDIRIINTRLFDVPARFNFRTAEFKLFYRDDIATRRLRPEIVTSEQALEQAEGIAKRSATRRPGGCPSLPTGSNGIGLPRFPSAFQPNSKSRSGGQPLASQSSLAPP